VEIKENESSSNGQYVQGNNRLKETSLGPHILHYELDLSEAKTFKKYGLELPPQEAMNQSEN